MGFGENRVLICFTFVSVFFWWMIYCCVWSIRASPVIAVLLFSLQTANDFMVICNVAKILELVVPLMEHPSETFLATIEEDLMKLIIKYGMTVRCSGIFRIFIGCSTQFGLSKVNCNEGHYMDDLMFCFPLSRWSSIVWAVLELLSTKSRTTTSLFGLASTDSMVRYTLYLTWTALTRISLQVLQVTNQENLTCISSFQANLHI